MGVFKDLQPDLKPDAPEYPENIDPGESMINYLENFLNPEFQDKFMGAERGMREMQRELGLQDAYATVFGSEQTPGQLDILEQIQPRVSDLQAQGLSAQREADISDVERLGSRAVEASRASDPAMQKLLGQQGTLVDQLFGRAQGVTPQQDRMAQQQARAAGSARGRGMGESTIASEILGREGFQRQNRDEYFGAANQRFGMLKQTGSDPFQAILGRPGTAYPGATQQQGFGQQTSLQNMMSGVLDPNAAINMAQQDRANFMNFQNANYNAQSQQYSGAVSAGGSILGALIMCWVAREVYGSDNDRWMLFRAWLLTMAPAWFYRWYLNNGQEFAQWLRNKPLLKRIIRVWMDGRIATLERTISYGI